MVNLVGSRFRNPQCLCFLERPSQRPRSRVEDCFLRSSTNRSVYHILWGQSGALAKQTRKQLQSRTGIDKDILISWCYQGIHCIHYWIPYLGDKSIQLFVEPRCKQSHVSSNTILVDADCLLRKFAWQFSTHGMCTIVITGKCSFAQDRSDFHRCNTLLVPPMWFM